MGGARFPVAVTAALPQAARISGGTDVLPWAAFRPGSILQR